MTRVSCVPVLVLYALVFASTFVAITDTTRVDTEAAPEAVKVYMDPSYIRATKVGQIVNVSILVENVVDLYAFQFGLMWDPSALQCLNLTWGEFLGEETISIAGTINNTAGEIYPPCDISRTNPLVGGGSGSGVLANVTFRTKAVGRFNVYPSEVVLLGAHRRLVIPAHVVHVFTVGLRPYELLPGFYVGVPAFHDIVVMTNCTQTPQTERTRIHGYAFDVGAKEIRFRITSSPYSYSPYFLGYHGETIVTGGFCEVSVPEGLLRAPSLRWKVLLNGAETPYIATVESP